MPNEMTEIEELGLASLRRKRQGVQREVMLEVLRPLTAEDLAGHSARQGELGVTTPSIKEIRHSHHLMARLAAEGHSLEHISLMTGFSPSRISILSNSPAFEELVAYYSTQEAAKDLDFRARIGGLGLTCLDEMTKRLEDSPDDISFKQLTETAEMAFTVAGMNAGVKNSNAAPTAAFAGLDLRIAFVEPPNGGSGSGQPAVIEGSATLVAESDEG